MKKCINIKTQKIILFIPYINVLILFFWLYNYYILQVENKVFFKSLMILFFRIFIFVIPQIILSKILGENSQINNIISKILIYIIPLSFGDGLIKHQSKIGIQ